MAAGEAANPKASLEWLSSTVALERRLGALAEGHGGSDEVRRFGRLLADDALLEADPAHRAGAAASASDALPPSGYAADLRALQSRPPGPDLDDAVLELARRLDSHALSLLVQVAPVLANSDARDALRLVQPLFDQHVRLAVFLERSERSN